MTGWERTGWRHLDSDEWQPVYADGVVGDPVTLELAELDADVTAVLAAIAPDPAPVVGLEQTEQATGERARGAGFAGTETDPDGGPDVDGEGAHSTGHG